MNPAFELTFLRFIRRHLLETMTLLYLVPIAWTGLVPFDFGSQLSAPIETAIVLGLPQATAHIPDVLCNIALYLPLGMLIRLTLMYRGWRRWTSLPVALAIGFTLSYATEWSQLHSPSRVSSFADLVANVGGCLVGALGASIGYVFIEAAREAGARWLERWRDSWRARPVVAGAQVCAIALFAASVAPFDLTFSPNHVYESVRETRLTPFSQDAHLSSAITPSTGAPPDKLRNASRRELWLLRIEHVSTGAAYALLAMFLCRYLSAHCAITGLRRCVWSVFVCGMIAFAGSAAKLFVISRTADVTDVLIALAGAAIGVLAADRLAHLWLREIDDRKKGTRATRRRIIGLALAAWCLLIAARELAPFSFKLSIASIGQQLKSIEWLPMEVYQRARLPIALDDLLTKAFWFAGFGLLVSAWWRLREDRRCPGIFTIAFGAGASVAALELAQVLLPVRTPSVTDVLLATLGAGVGAAAFRLVVAWLEEVRFEKDEERVLLNVELPTHADAPREQIPKRRKRSAAPSHPDD